jgi:hypothetical protein
VKVFTCTSFTGFWPVGVSAVIVAASLSDATAMLHLELANVGLEQKNTMLF